MEVWQPSSLESRLNRQSVPKALAFMFSFVREERGQARESRTNLGKLRKVPLDPK